jgi:hypothetical protein
VHPGAVLAAVSWGEAIGFVEGPQFSAEPATGEASEDPNRQAQDLLAALLRG